MGKYGEPDSDIPYAAERKVMPKIKPENPKFILEVEALSVPGTVPIVRLRSLLKMMLRSFSFKCRGVSPANDAARPGGAANVTTSRNPM